MLSCERFQFERNFYFHCVLCGFARDQVFKPFKATSRQDAKIAKENPVYLFLINRITIVLLPVGKE